MGNTCCCSNADDKLEENQLDNLVKIQTAFRGYRAKKKLEGRKNKKLDSLFSNSSSNLHSANNTGGVLSAQTQSMKWTRETSRHNSKAHSKNPSLGGNAALIKFNI
jgi:hypothetical protein